MILRYLPNTPSSSPAASISISFADSAKLVSFVATGLFAAIDDECPPRRLLRRSRLHWPPHPLHHCMPQHPHASKNPPQRRLPLPLSVSPVDSDCLSFGLPGSGDHPSLRHLYPPHPLAGDRPEYLFFLRQLPHLTQILTSRMVDSLNMSLPLIFLGFKMHDPIRKTKRILVIECCYFMPPIAF